MIPETLWLAPITVMFEPVSTDASFRELKAVQVLGIIVLIHVILWLPSFIMYDIDIAQGTESNYSLLRFLAYMNTVANPFLYAFSSEDFQRIYRNSLSSRQPNAEAAPAAAAAAAAAAAGGKKLVSKKVLEKHEDTVRVKEGEVDKEVGIHASASLKSETSANVFQQVPAEAKASKETFVLIVASKTDAKKKTSKMNAKDTDVNDLCC
ncbi:alpha-1A adrenergic receptor [Elysia marginata]|uniref:Alpha-1A adrenergic receptor n=1 Tax=Elysia marginata TaxID=1093978 RepID=A0AAV4GRG9_9GAST|nr:alpha-1A adrenergic receptor [Elysia marginata]